MLEETFPDQNKNLRVKLDYPTSAKQEHEKNILPVKFQIIRDKKKTLTYYQYRGI